MDMDHAAEQEIQRLFNGKAKNIRKADLGTYADLKYFAEFSGKKYLVKMTSKYNMRGNLADVGREIRKAGIPLHAAEYSLYSKKLKRHFNVYGWLEGKNLQELFQNMTAAEQETWGETAGKILRRFHEFKTTLPIEETRNLENEYRHYRFYCWLKKIHFPHKEEYDAYFKKNAHILRNRPVTFVHMDFQPKNLMLCEDGLYAIDFENCMFTDPWMDFMCNLVLCPPGQEFFTTGLLNGYFPQGVPEEFFQVTSLMAILSLYRYAMWKYQNKGRMVVLQAENLYRMYDGLTNPVPDYLRECVKREEKYHVQEKSKN